MSKIYSRGLNYFGQSGLGKLKYSTKFMPLEIEEEGFAKVFTNLGMSYALANGELYLIQIISIYTSVVSYMI